MVEIGTSRVFGNRGRAVLLYVQCILSALGVERVADHLKDGKFSLIGRIALFVSRMIIVTSVDISESQPTTMSKVTGSREDEVVSVVEYAKMSSGLVEVSVVRRSNELLCCLSRPYCTLAVTK